MTARPPRLRVAEPVIGREFSRTYPGRPDQVRLARAFVRETVASSPAAADVVLAASELITNAISHSRSGAPGGLFTVRVRLRPGRDVHIEVDDEGGRWEIRVCDLEHGRGLTVVAGLAGEPNWGITGSGTARTVWVRFGWSGTVQSTTSPTEAVTTEGDASHG